MITNTESQDKPGSKEFTGYSDNFSFEEAFKDAISKAPSDLPTDYYKYKVVETGYERGGIADVDRLFVVIKQVSPE